MAVEQHHRVGAGEAGGDPLAQRPRRQQAAIAEAVGGVDHDQRQILGDGRVLEAVIEHDRPRAALDSGPHSGGAVAGHPARRRGRRQQRLVADRGGIVDRGIDPHRPGQASAIAAHDDMRASTPWSRSISDKAQDDGVLPAPPATRLPTQITGTGAR